MELVHLATVIVLIYMLIVPGLALLRYSNVPMLGRSAAALYGGLQRLGIHQSWVMFTGGPLDRSRELSLRFDLSDGRHANPESLDALPPPHIAYLQHWLFANARTRAAVIDAVLHHCVWPDGAELPRSLSIVLRGRVVARPGSALRGSESAAVIAVAPLENDE